MPRNRYLVAYDIADDRRLRLVHRCVLGFGHPLQYSVFICDLTPRELIALRTGLRDIIDHRSDAIAIADLGLATDGGKASLQFMGRSVQLPSTNGPTIV